ncbi:small subunit ribosomal protein S3 [Ruminococcaceae bacterium YRB3002]|nr:small subunit ribosomal protein S3 [Ruminococcaceae bacterium YRB3002]
MGQKVNPHGLRVGVIKDWNARWYADKKNFGDQLVEDRQIREFILKKTDEIVKANAKNNAGKKPIDETRTNVAGISDIIIERKDASTIKLIIRTGSPALVIGSKGASLAALRTAFEKKFGKGKDNFKVSIDVEDIKNRDANATLVAQNIAAQLESRVSFRRAMKRAMSQAMKMNIKGIKTMCSGRLGGAEIARSETYHEGTIPLQTLRADIDYGFAEANTTYGRIGVKVWIYNGEIIPEKKNKGEGGEA